MKERFEYIDALRGFTMLLVIYAHFAGLVAQGADGDIGIFCSVIMHRIRMPLFFFVSGFFAYALYDSALFRKRLRNRITKQLWPTVVVCTLYVTVTGAIMNGGG